MNRFFVSLKKKVSSAREHRWVRKSAVVAATATAVALPSAALAALPTDAATMLTTATGYLGDIATGVGTLGLAAIGIVILMGVIGVVMMFARRPAG